MCAEIHGVDVRATWDRLFASLGGEGENDKPADAPAPAPSDPAPAPAEAPPAEKAPEIVALRDGPSIVPKLSDITEAIYDDRPPEIRPWLSFNYGLPLRKVPIYSYVGA